MLHLLFPMRTCKCGTRSRVMTSTDSEKKKSAAGKYEKGKFKVGIHVNINGFKNLWEHTAHTPQMMKALETCPLQAHPKKEGDTPPMMFDHIYSSERKLRILGAHKPGASRFVKKATNMKTKPEMALVASPSPSREPLQRCPSGLRSLARKPLPVLTAPAGQALPPPPILPVATSCAIISLIWR